MSSWHQSIRKKHREQHGRCWLCNLWVNLALPPDNPKGPSLDHVIEKRMGGTGLPNNKRLAHRDCNIKRHLLFPHLSTDKVSAVRVEQEAIASYG